MKPNWSLKAFTKSTITLSGYPNYWDLIALLLVVGAIVLLGWGFSQMAAPYQIGEVIPIYLDPSYLPYYSLRTVLRMFIALFCSLVFTFIFGTWAAKSKEAERIIIPAIDILQSVPILGFLTITLIFFMALFRGSILGPECAAIFAIFTSQVWNITLSFYQSLKTVPADLKEAARMFHLSAWQRFWRIEVPFAMPGLLWNVMVSMSASWFYVVASEAISVANQNISLPGVGSYIALAVAHADIKAIFYAIIAMFLVILIYDQLLFRPLSIWTEKFKAEETLDESVADSWIVNIFQRTRWLRRQTEKITGLWDNFVNLALFNRRTTHKQVIFSPWYKKIVWSWRIILMLVLLASAYLITKFILTTVTVAEIKQVVFLGALTATRVIILIILASLIWVPIGVWIGNRPRITQIAQPVVQFLAAFPAYLFFPVVVMLIAKYKLNVEIWTSPLMVLGTQWYILFNVIAGTSTLPKDLRQATSNLGVTGLLWWRRFVFPGIFPYFLTGAITAAGGAWNASIIAESVSWGSTHFQATGLGAYITHYTVSGDFQRITLGIVIMCLYVLLMNWLIWRPLYRLAEERFQF